MVERKEIKCMQSSEVIPKLFHVKDPETAPHLIRVSPRVTHLTGI